MYGIAGIISPHTSFVTKERLQAMHDMLPNADNTSIWINIELNAGLVFPNTNIANNQYLHYTISLDGEIYNYKKLQTELETLGYTFPIQNDEIIVIAAFDRWKEKCMEHLDGAFVFSIYDSLEESIYLVRDRLGEKQLYYYAHFQERGRFVQLLFASEMKVLWHAGAPKNLDGTMMLNYLTLGYTSNPNKKMATFYSDILSLPAGHFLKIFPKEGRTQMRCRYRPTWQRNDNISDNNAIEQFQSILRDAISNRISDKDSIGLIWDNELNSSAIAALTKDITKQNILSKIFSTKDDNLDQQIVDELQLTFIYAQPDMEKSEKEMYSFFELLEEPISETNPFVQYKANHIANRHQCTKLLDTLGADEILGGKNVYVAYYLQYLLRENYSLFKNEKRMFQENDFLVNWKFKNYINAFTSEKESSSEQKSLEKKQKQFPFLNEDFLLHYQNPDILRQPEIHQPEDLMFFDIFTTGIENQLKWKNKIATHFGQVMRYPFLQYRLIEFLFSLPSNFKFRDGFNKWILRKSIENILPRSLAWQKNILDGKPFLFEVPASSVENAVKKLIDAKVLTNKVLIDQSKRKSFDKNQEWRIVNTAYFIENI